jgi:hypothetical protein
MDVVGLILLCLLEGDCYVGFGCYRCYCRYLWFGSSLGSC